MLYMYDVITTLSVEDHLRIGNVIPCNHFSVNQHNKAVKVKCFLWQTSIYQWQNKFTGACIKLSKLYNVFWINHLIIEVDKNWWIPCFVYNTQKMTIFVFSRKCCVFWFTNTPICSTSCDSSNLYNAFVSIQIWLREQATCGIAGVLW